MHPLFGTKHLILVAISLILVAVGFIFSKKLSFKTMTRVMLYIGLISETIKIFYYIITNEDKFGGVLPKSDLPFHLCSIQILFIVLLNISENEKLKSMLTSFMMPSCLVGGLAALHSSILRLPCGYNGIRALSDRIRAVRPKNDRIPRLPQDALDHNVLRLLYQQYSL